MLQKIGFAPGINKQVTPTGAKVNGSTVIMLGLDMVHLKK